MSFVYEAAVLSVSLLALVVFADRLVDVAVRLAKALGISPTVIGLTLIAYGTSLPEFAVSTIAAPTSSQIAIGNIIGSNIFNIAGIIGLVAFLGYLDKPVKGQGLMRDAWVMEASAALIILLLFLNNGIGLISGVLMASALGAYTIYVLRDGNKKKNRAKKQGSISALKEFARSLFCLGGLILSARFTVDSSVNIAAMLGISEWVIGATIIAAGTSLPELMVSLAAAKKNQIGLSLGNIIGSNIFNILWILGIAAWISPMELAFSFIRMDAVFLAVTTTALLYCVTRQKITRLDGMLLLLLYTWYIAQLVTA